MSKQKKEKINRGATPSTLLNEEQNFISGDYYLLVIGINQYLNYDKLGNAVNDAKGLAGVLKSSYKFKKTTELINGEATRHNILKALEDFEKINPNDNLLIFFAGHGYAKDPLGYIIPVDAPADTRTGFIPYSTIIEQFRLIAARHILLIIDCCYAGYLINYRGGSDKNKAIELEEQLKSRKFLTSGYKEKVPDGPVGGNSPFVKSLLSILKSNDQPKLSINSLFQKIKVEIKSIPQVDKTPSPMYHELISVGDKGGSMVLYLENAENEELKAYKKAISLRTKQVLDFFINEFKDSQYKAEIEAIFQDEYDQQEKAWEEVRKVKTVKSISSYLDKYPNEFFSTAAKRELLRIENLIAQSKPFYQKALEVKSIADKEAEANAEVPNKAIIHTIDEKYKEAINYLTQAIVIYPDFEDAYYVRANLNKFFDNHQMVIDDFNEALRIEYDAFTYSERAFAKLKMGQSEEALKDFNSIVEREPNNAALYSNRAIVKEKIGDFKGALQDYLRTIELDPNDVFSKTMVTELKDKLKNIES